MRAGTWRANDKTVKTRRIHQDACRLTIHPLIESIPRHRGIRRCTVRVCRHVLWIIDVRRKSRNAYVGHTHGSSVLSLLFVYFALPTVPLARNVRRKLSVSARDPRPRAASMRKRARARFCATPTPIALRAHAQ